MDIEACDGEQGNLCILLRLIGSSSKAIEGCCKAILGSIGDRMPNESIVGYVRELNTLQKQL